MLDFQLERCLFTPAKGIAKRMLFIKFWPQGTAPFQAFGEAIPGFEPGLSCSQGDNHILLSVSVTPSPMQNNIEMNSDRINRFLQEFILNPVETDSLPLPVFLELCIRIL